MGLPGARDGSGRRYCFVVGRSTTETGSRPFVGRERERVLLGDLLLRVAEGRPGAFLLHGEAGVGKTRLLEATVEEARERGIEVLRGTCVHFTTSVVPYGALVLALRSWQAEGERALSDGFARLLAAADPNRQAETAARRRC